MIATIIQELKPIIETKCFIDCFGGLAIPVSRLLPDKTKNALKKQTFPISCSACIDDCFSDGSYADLLPNDKFKSVSYFEVLQGTRALQRIGSKKEPLFVFGAKLRFVLWANMPKLGYSDCSISDLLESDLIRFFYNTKFNIDIPFPVSDIHLDFVESVVKTPSNIFGKYSYVDMANDFTLKPFDYLALDFNLSWTISLNCIPEFECKEEIPC